MSDLAIRARNIGKEYFIGGPQKQFDTLGAQLVDTVQSPFRRARKLLRGQATGAAELDQKFWALDGIDFDIKRGETVGIIGRNGAGKSTLLKILSRITEPTRGTATIYGRVGSLLEVGTGFHPELTGRENVFLNGAILGMRKSEIESRFDEIVAFAEIERFIDTPVKHYSSGMYVRLAFAVAAHLEPEVLLVDEVLAVGDMAFQKKCLGKMDDVASQGRTVLFVSHNMSLIQALCQRGIYLLDGRIAADGSVSEAVDAYLRSLESAGSEDLLERTDRGGTGRSRLVGVDISSDDELSSALATGRPARFTFHVSQLVPGLACVVSVLDHLGQIVTTFKSGMRGDEDIVDADIGAAFICEMDQLLLAPGRYHLNVFLRTASEWQDTVEGAAIFDVHDGRIDGRPVRFSRNVNVCLPHRWTLPVAD